MPRSRFQDAHGPIPRAHLLAHPQVGGVARRRPRRYSRNVCENLPFDGAYQGNGSFRSWIYRIATNEALRCLCKRQEETVSLESETTGVTLIADNSLEEADKLAAKLQRAILTLSPKQQLAFNLRYYDELCFSEIARVADSTPTSIRQSYHVAKEKIIKYMNQND